MRLAEFIGKDRLKVALADRTSKARARGEAMSHLLLSGYPESGRRTLANAVAEELDIQITVRHSGEFSKISDLTGVLSNIRARQVLVVDDLESLDARFHQMLKSALTDYRVPVLVGTGPNARLHDLPMPRFTFVGLTSNLPRVDQSLRRLFVMYEFDPYELGEVGAIMIRLAQTCGIMITATAAASLAERCVGVPGNAAVLVARIDRECEVNAIDAADVPAVLAELGYDQHYPKGLQLQGALISLALQQSPKEGREGIPTAVRRAVWTRDAGMCAQCGSRERLEYDHIIPISKGGSNTERNIELLCEACNRAKSNAIM
jgi:holliday junction DNA helicase RuvB